MNDFTKEELELIAECVDSDFLCTNWPKSMYEPLINKIKSMIDNYCEHEDTLLNCGDEYCVKCKRLLNGNISKNLLDYISTKVIEKHKTCLTDQFDNGYFWAMKDLQEKILIGGFDDYK